MDVGLDRAGASVPCAARAVILLDTNAVIWLAQDHKRTRLLSRFPRIYVSPATVLELQFLVEAGRVRPAPGLSAVAIGDDPRWLLDDPPAVRWFSTAAEVGWTRDPFDRLLVAHALMRGWRLATGDTAVLERLSPAECLAL
jgi:PIN domain nuclease of toxin-antitoxin system